MSALLKKTHEFRGAAVEGLTAAQERDLDRAASTAWHAGFDAPADSTLLAYANAADAMRDIYRLAAEGRS